MDLHPGRNVYLTSWFILSVFYFLTGLGETCLPDKLVHSVCVVLDTVVCGPYIWDPPSQDLQPSRNVYLTSWVIPRR